MKKEDIKKGDEINVLQTQSLAFGYPIKAGVYIFESWEYKFEQCFIREKHAPQGKFFLIESKCIVS